MSARIAERAIIVPRMKEATSAKSSVSAVQQFDKLYMENTLLRCRRIVLP